MISDLAKKYPADVIRFMLLSHHYREPWEFEDLEMDDVKRKISEIKKALKNKSAKGKSRLNYFRKFQGLMDDDLNTPKALELISEMAYDINKNNVDLKQDMKKCLEILGFVV